MNSGSSFSFLTYLWPTGIQGTWQKVNCMVKSRATDSDTEHPTPQPCTHTRFEDHVQEAVVLWLCNRSSWCKSILSIQFVFWCVIRFSALTWSANRFHFRDVIPTSTWCWKEYRSFLSWTRLIYATNQSAWRWPQDLGMKERKTCYSATWGNNTTRVSKK